MPPPRTVAPTNSNSELSLTLKPARRKLLKNIFSTNYRCNYDHHVLILFSYSLGVESGIKMYKGEEVLSFEGTVDKESGTRCLA